MILRAEMKPRHQFAFCFQLPILIFVLQPTSTFNKSNKLI